VEKTLWRKGVSMSKTYLFSILLAVSLLGFTSCAKTDAMWQVIVGNYRYEQGLYPQATTHYFNALQQEYEADVIQFNLGVLYHAQGEVEAALSKWALLDATSLPLLRAKAHYNQGVVYYQLGDYPKAIDQFRLSLALNAQDVSAKINLEIAQNTYYRLQNNDSSQLPESGGPLSEQSLRQLDYLKRRSTLFVPTDAQESTWFDPDDL
jgi:tetratricopeptide (TPR) repeat protein